MTVDERTVTAVLNRMADEAEWKSGLPHRTLIRARVRRSITVALAVVLLAGLGYGSALVANAFTSTNQAAAPRLSGKIVFKGPGGIWVMSADGSHVHRITHVRGDVSPSWSPDGRSIVFQRFVAGRTDIYVIRSDGTQLRRLTSDGRSAEPAWSPNGTTIAFTREFPTHGRREERIRIFLMRADGSHVRPASSTSSLQYETSPSWAPDGKRLAFAGYGRRPSNGPAPVGHIYLLSLGGPPRRMGNAAGDDLHPAWGPDGHTLVFVDDGPQGGSVSIMSTTRSTIDRLTSDPGLTDSPAWSPDGESIVFSRGPDSKKMRLYTYDLKGGRTHALTSAQLAPAMDPSWWSPRPSVTPSPTSSQLVSNRLVALSRTHVRNGITDVAVSKDAVWVTGFQKLTRVDPASGHIVATIRLPGLGDYSSVAVGEGALWVEASERGFRGVYKIDPATNAILDRISLSPGLQGIAVGAGSVWVTHPRAGYGNVIRIDARTDRVISKPITVGHGPVPVLYAAGAVFVTNTDFGGSVSRIDVHTGAVTRTWGTADDVQAFGAGSLWGVGNDEVVRIDVHTGRVIAAIPLKRAAAVAYGGGRVWAISDPRSKSTTLYEPDPRHPGTVVTIDPATNRISSAPIPYGETAAYIAARGPVAWIGDYNRQVLTRVEATGR